MMVICIHVPSQNPASLLQTLCNTPHISVVVVVHQQSALAVHQMGPDFCVANLNVTSKITY